MEVDLAAVSSGPAGDLAAINLKLMVDPEEVQVKVVLVEVELNLVVRELVVGWSEQQAA